ncbi:ArsC family reductase [Shewanella jiangmenensis]|uniref:ArsC family reductase n=1 Tax=Shewanella jiangmenensis TaxID=2837387 RepID=UPI0032D96FD2
MTLYGIKNCDTVKKARNWLDSHGQQVQFHDFRADGLSKDTLSAWVDALGVDTVLNRKSTSFRALDEAQKQNIDRDSAIALMLETPTLIKRPVLEYQGKVYCGFSDKLYTEVFGQ